VPTDRRRRLCAGVDRRNARAVLDVAAQRSHVARDEAFQVWRCQGTRSIELRQRTRSWPAFATMRGPLLPSQSSSRTPSRVRQLRRREWSIRWIAFTVKNPPRSAITASNVQGRVPRGQSVLSGEASNRQSILLAGGRDAFLLSVVVTEVRRGDRERRDDRLNPIRTGPGRSRQSRSRRRPGDVGRRNIIEVRQVGVPQTVPSSEVLYLAQVSAIRSAFPR